MRDSDNTRDSASARWHTARLRWSFLRDEKQCQGKNQPPSSPRFCLWGIAHACTRWSRRTLQRQPRAGLQGTWMRCAHRPLRVVSPALRHLESEVVIRCGLRAHSRCAQTVRAFSVYRASGAPCRRVAASGMLLAVITPKRCLCIVCSLWRDASAPGGE